MLNAADLETLARLAESGAVTPVVDRTYPLEDAAEAIRNIASGKGVVVI